LADRKLEKIKFDVLKPHAYKFDVELQDDLVRPGNSPPERAFVVLSCAFELLVTLAEVAFPALDRKTRRRGAKWTRQSLLFLGGDAAVMLANAMTNLLVHTEGRLALDEPPVVGVEEHRRLRDAVHSFYPVPTARSAFLPGCEEEFRVMESHQPRQPVAEGEQEPNEYSRALLRGENPDEDPRLVRLQQEYARDFYIDRATNDVMRRALPKMDRKMLGEKLVRFGALNESDAAEFRQRALAGWIEGLKPYHEYALIDAGS
jgi:hypothetical protein